VSLLTATLAREAGDSAASPNDMASQRANIAIALLRLGAGERLWPFLKESPDPRVRSYVIDRFAALRCDPETLLSHLDTEPDHTVRAALWLGLGGFDETALPRERRGQLMPMIQTVYRQDPSAAVHAAARWLLTKWGVEDLSLPPDQVFGDANKDKKWYVNSVGQTLVRIRGPVTFMMGPLPEEPRRQMYEQRQEAQINYSFDIAMTEVTVGQFRQYLAERGRGGEFADRQADLPAPKITWYDAVEFCNWLSKAEGISPDQYCYEPNNERKYGHGMKVVADYQRRIGYRLPTEVEWEFACRAGSDASRCYGDAEELLPRYAWYAFNAPEDYAPVARLLPNLFGLFDMHGNSAEWCQNPMRLDEPRHEARPSVDIVDSDTYRAVRGGSVFNYSNYIRSAKRFAERPSIIEGRGFRVVRSRP
jgi:formylglycine-generating enzyme required for sulfatase activity